MKLFFKRVKTLIISNIMVCSPLIVSASDWGNIKEDENFQGFVRLLQGAFFAIGAGFTIFGAFQFATGFRSDDAEAKAKGMRNMIAGVMMMLIGGLTEQTILGT